MNTYWLWFIILAFIFIAFKILFRKTEDDYDE